MTTAAPQSIQPKIAGAAKLTKRQLEILAQCSGPHGMYDHNRWDTGVLNRLYEKGLALQSCNGTGKWHATRAGRAALEPEKPL